MPTPVKSKTTLTWTRDQKIGTATVCICVLGLSLSFLVPEVRQFFGLEHKPEAVLNAKSSESFSKKPTVSPNEADAEISKLRALHGVSLILINESGKSLSEMPVNSYAFVDPFDLVVYTSIRASEQPSIYPNHVTRGMEIHKLQDATVQIVCYVGSETLTRLRAGLRKHDQLTIYSRNWEEARNLVSIPLTELEVFRRRDIPTETNVEALDCTAK
jgi:hypothetical protein